MIDLDTIEQHATGAGSNQSGSAFISPVTVIEMTTLINDVIPLLLDYRYAIENRGLVIDIDNRDKINGVLGRLK